MHRTVRKSRTNGAPHRVTMVDVARRAKVSQSAVSFVLSGSENSRKISEKTAARIRRKWPGNWTFIPAMRKRSNWRARADRRRVRQLLLSKSNPGSGFSRVLPRRRQRGMRSRKKAKIAPRRPRHLLIVAAPGNVDGLISSPCTMTPFKQSGRIAGTSAAGYLGRRGRESQQLQCGILTWAMGCGRRSGIYTHKGGGVW